MSLAALLAFVLIFILPMLGTRTKQVFSYGRRNRRVVNDRHDLFDVDDAKKTSGQSGPRELGQTYATYVTTPSRRRHRTGKEPKIMPSPSSVVSPPLPSHICTKKRRENVQAYSSLKRRPSSSFSRQPLSSHPVNVSGRSSLSGPKKKNTRLSGSSGPPLPQSPAVDVDIFVLDENGRRVSQERRVSKTNVQVNQRTIIHPGSAMQPRSTVTSVIVVSDNDDDDDPSPQLKRRSKRWPTVMSSSDEEDVAKISIRSVSCHNSPRHNTNREDPSETPEVTNHLKPQIPRPCLNPTISSKSHFWVEIPNLRSPARSRGQPQGLTLYDSPLQPPRDKHHPLTPIRGKGLAFPRLPPSPSTIVDLDLSLDFADLTFSSTPVATHTVNDQPPHLIPLLDECGQDAPIEFSAFIEAFPVHPIVKSSYSGRAEFQKIGEASYSEVFGIGDVVLKIIPIRNEECLDKIDAEMPAPSDAKDILKEVLVTRALGETCNGFVNLLKTYVVRGKYPSLLLDLWDEYNQTKGSESVRPGAAPRVSSTHRQSELA
jgi:serine/threonine-protein kinase haspin